MSQLRTVTKIIELRKHLDEARAEGSRVGFVPTMGYLHSGHGSLITNAAADNDVVVVSIFINPLQFAADEDLSTYPRDPKGDLELAERAGATLAFCPDAVEMYPREVLTTVSVAEVSANFDGASRPAHFAGVATVVAKLFSIVGPCTAYFGEKDYQQLTVVRRMAGDLSMPVDVVGCPTSREHDGLALSSRNVYLSEAERTAAPTLYRALLAGRDRILDGERSRRAVEAAMEEVVSAEALITLDYAAAVDADDLSSSARLTGDIRLLIAGKLGQPRLIDNIGVSVPDHAEAPDAR